MAVQQRTIQFSGMVQGVGFRFAAVRTAEDFEVTGYVRNLPDGRVECVVEGESSQIDAFLDILVERMSGYIRQQTQQDAPYTGKFDSFTVRY